MNRLLGLICLLAAWPLAAAEPARIAIIIDDLGNHRTLGHRALALPGALTYSVLPRRPHSADIARRAHAAGKEVMLHLPMQTSDGRRMGGGGLSLSMDRRQFMYALRDSLASVPHVVGVNNHMGSLLTQHPGAMRWLMEDLACYDRLYFVDSRTDVRTVARRQARAAGLANAERDVFLDNRQEPEYIRGQLHRLIAEARRHGSAIGIGHPYPATLAVLAEELPRLAEQGIQLVPVSRLVERQRNDRLWHASSSPLRTAAKNSKP
ncbi:MAG: divergent polysaccharide deacetylase family protein [Gammaproteobacteria bacterium]|nr:divergent polysaccharide deacetylase family protein [Gammaproteobacteria bacterium]